MEVESKGVAVEGGEVPVRVCIGAKTPSPALLIVPSIFGIAEDLEEQMKQLAQGGFTVAALDPFWRVEPGPLAYDAFEKALGRMQRMDRELLLGDFVAVRRWLGGLEPGHPKVAGLGICFGGPVVFVAAGEGLLDAVVTWHGSRLPDFAHRVSQSTIPLRLHWGGADSVAPPEHVARVREALAEHPDFELVVHPGAEHGFSHPASPRYQPQAEAAAMEATRAVLEKLRARG